MTTNKCAYEIAENIMTKVDTDFDIFTWESFDEDAKNSMIQNIIQSIASFKANPNVSRIDNRSNRLTVIENGIEVALILLAKKEGYIS